MEDEKLSPEMTAHLERFEQLKAQAAQEAEEYLEQLIATETQQGAGEQNSSRLDDLERQIVALHGEVQTLRGVVAVLHEAFKSPTVDQSVRVGEV